MKNKNYIIILILLLVQSFTFAQKTNDNVDSDYLKYYHNNYNAARQYFIENSNEILQKYENSKLIKIDVPSKIDNNLTIDILYIPQEGHKNKLMILSSGVHGVEGHVGSAIQSMFLEKFLNENLIKKTGVLFIHSINPYGYKYNRRVSENNIDLNRNSTTSTELYNTINEGYPKVSEFINPQKRVNTKSLSNRLFTIRAIMQIIRKSMPVLRQAILQGQYQFEKGVYFGGKKQEPQIISLSPIIDSICKPYNTIFEMDLHTGYGEKGKLHFFPNPTDSITKNNLENIFYGYKIDWGDSDDFYTVTGDFVDFVGQLNKDKIYLPMTFEYGTLNSQTTKGSLESIKRVILENQGTHYGFKTEKDKAKVKKDFLEMYYPNSKDWKNKIMKDTEELYKKIIPRFLNSNF